MELWPWPGRGSAMNAIEADDLPTGEMSNNKARSEFRRALGWNENDPGPIP